MKTTEEILHWIELELMINEKISKDYSEMNKILVSVSTKELKRLKAFITGMDEV